MNKLLIIFWVMAFIAVLVFFVQRQIFTYKFAELKYKQDYSEWQMKNYEKELIKFCQQLSATATNSKWTYANCLKGVGVKNEPIYLD